VCPRFSQCLEYSFTLLAALRNQILHELFSKGKVSDTKIYRIMGGMSRNIPKIIPIYPKPELSPRAVC
jgi:hypothetical protein